MALDSGRMKLLEAFTFISDALFLSVCFFLGTALGLGVLGLSPALHALASASRDRRVNEIGESAWRLFWREYFTEFWAANRVLSFPLFVLLIAGANYVLADYRTGEQSLYVQIAFGVVVCLASLFVTYVGWDRQFQSPGAYTRAGRNILLKPGINLGLIAATALLVRLAFWIDGFGFLLGVGLWAEIVSLLTKGVDGGTSD